MKRKQDRSGRPGKRIGTMMVLLEGASRRKGALALRAEPELKFAGERQMASDNFDFKATHAHAERRLFLGSNRNHYCTASVQTASTGKTTVNQTTHMKKQLLILTLALGASTYLMAAQEDAPRPEAGQRPPHREGGRGGPGMDGMRPPPMIVALDLNKDGVIDAEEIAKASESLKTLDKNKDGKLTPDELRPERKGGRGGPGGEGRPGHRGGRGGEDRPQKPAQEQ